MASFYKYQTPQDPIACRIGTITRDAGIASLLKEICMREMTKEEMSQVSGAGFSDYVGAVVGAVCAAFTRGVGGATTCAVAGVAATDLANAAGSADWSKAPDMGSYSNNMPAGMQ